MTEDTAEAALRLRLRTINVELDGINVRRNSLMSERSSLELELCRLQHPCECVKLNRDLDIYDMVEQGRRQRSPLGIGTWVCDTLSADRDCPRCHGSGVPA